MNDHPRSLTSLTPEEKFAKRAQLLAQAEDEQEERHKLFTVAVVRVGGALYGLPVEGIREIIATPPLAPLPNTAPWFLGITHLRGELLSVVHLADWIEVETVARAAFLAIVEGPEGPLGLAVEKVLEFRDIFAEEIAQIFDKSQVDADKPFRATTKDVITILDLDRITKDPRLVIDQSKSGQTGPMEETT